jgi:hypothetical protein
VSDPESDGGGLGIGEDDIATKSGRNLTKDLGAIDRIWPRLRFRRQEARTGPVCLNRFSASISGASTGVRPPCGLAAG